MVRLDGSPVIDLDISKDESHAQVFKVRGLPHGKTFKFKHDLEGLASFLTYWEGELAAGMRPTIVMEATGLSGRFGSSFSYISWCFTDVEVIQQICPLV